MDERKAHFGISDLTLDLHHKLDVSYCHSSLAPFILNRQKLSEQNRRVYRSMYGFLVNGISI
jgi:hypothetical protein